MTHNPTPILCADCLDCFVDAPGDKCRECREVWADAGRNGWPDPDDLYVGGDAYDSARDRDEEARCNAR